MDAADYLDYLERLAAGLGDDPRVRGLVALGSTAATVRKPDEWSDHDLWVVVEPGTEEDFRTDPSWLPDHGRLLLWMRETEHGMKAVYDDGHLVEVAVFRPDELTVARINTFRVLLDKGGVAAAIPEVRAATEADLTARRRSTGHLLGQFVTGLLVGLNRYARGEVLSGHEFVKVHAAGHLLALLPKVLDPEDPDAIDDLNPWRRVELAFPDVAASIADSLTEEVPRAALGLLATAETSVKPQIDSWPSGVAAIVRKTATRLL